MPVPEGGLVRATIRFVLEHYVVRHGAAADSEPDEEEVYRNIRESSLFLSYVSHRNQEHAAILAGGRKAARAHARLTALSARSAVANLEDVLKRAESPEAADRAAEAAQALTALLSACYDGPDQTFACARGPGD